MDDGGLQSTSALQILHRLLTFPSITSTVSIASTTYLAMAVVSQTFGFEVQDDDGVGHLSASVEMLSTHAAAAGPAVIGRNDERRRDALSSFRSVTFCPGPTGDKTR